MVIIKMIFVLIVLLYLVDLKLIVIVLHVLLHIIIMDLNVFVLKLLNKQMEDVLQVVNLGRYWIQKEIVIGVL